MCIRDRARKAGLVGWQLEIVTRRVEQSWDLAQVLEALREGRLSVRARHALFRAAGGLVRELHRLGLVHADLTPRNLLVEERQLETAEPELWILDLDQSVFLPALSDRQRRRNLHRLLRAVLRREARGHRFLARTDFARFLRGYDAEGRRWQAEWRAVQADYRRGWFLHQVGWRLEQALGSGPDTRDGKAVVRG